MNKYISIYFKASRISALQIYTLLKNPTIENHPIICMSVNPVYNKQEKKSHCKSRSKDLYSGQVVTCHVRVDGVAKHDKIRDRMVAVFSAAIITPVVENLIPESKIKPGDIFITL